MRNPTYGKRWRARIGSRLLVFGVIYCFGIKGGIGAESLSAFFHLLHLETRIGCSASALRELEVQVKEQIVAYGQVQFPLRLKENRPSAESVGADETFSLAANSGGGGISQWVYLQ